MTIEFDLPLPPPELQPNARIVWQAKARLTKQRRNTVAALTTLTRLVPREPLTRALVAFTIIRPTKRTIDPDNALAWFKSTIDGMTDAGLFADDKELQYAPVEQRKELGEPAKLVVRIESDQLQ